MRRKTTIVLVSLAAVLAGAATWLVLRPGPEDHMAALVAELRARGEPVTYEDLRQPMPPERENGAHALDQAHLWLQARLDRASEEVDEYSFRAHYIGPWEEDGDAWYVNASPGRVEELRGFLATMQPLYRRLDATAATPVIAWHADEEILHSDAQEFWAPWQRIREILGTRLVAAETHDNRLATMRWLIDIPRSVRSSSYSDTVMLAYERRRGCTSLRDAIESGHIDPSTARAQLDALLVAPGLEAMPAAVRATRVDMIAFFPSLLDGSLQRTHRANIRTINELVFDDPAPTALERAENVVQDGLAGVTFDWRAHLAALRDIDLVLPADGVWDADADRALATFEQAHGQLASVARNRLREAVAAESLARIALAVCAHRTEHGDWPVATAELAPLFPAGVPLDPYTNAPFAIEREGDTIILRASPPTGRLQGSLRDAGLEWRLVPR